MTIFKAINVVYLLISNINVGGKVTLYYEVTQVHVLVDVLNNSLPSNKFDVTYTFKDKVVV
jgi:hypothetical protein